MTVVTPINTFIQFATNLQNQKKPGGQRLHWTAAELKDMRSIANSVYIGDFSQTQAVAAYRKSKELNKPVGSIRSNKTTTAFRLKLAALIKEIGEEKQTA